MSVLRRARVSLLLGALVALPFVAADKANTGISPLNSVIELLSTLLNIPVLSNPTVKLGFIKFALFVILMAISHYGFRQIPGMGQDAKTVGVLSVMFSLIGALLMPANWVSANGAVITTIYSGFIPLGLVILLIWICLTKLNQSFLSNLFAFLILLMLLAFLNVYSSALGLPILLFIPAKYLRGKR
jgi:hypothetical protein